MKRPGTPKETDEWLKMIHDRLEGIERALTPAQASGQDEGSTKSNVKKDPPKEKKADPPPPTRGNTQEKELKGLERFECDICGKQFSSERGLKAHKTKAHK